MRHLGDRLVELATEAVAPHERSVLEAHLARCARCRADLEAVRAALTGLALGLSPQAPPGALRARLAAEVRGRGRFLPFADRVAHHFALASDQAEALLGQMDESSAWAPDSLVPGGELRLVSPGASLAGAITALIRMPPGSRYPRHRHRAEERLLFLQGGVELDDGSIADAGTLLVSEPGSVHGFTVLPGPPCVAAVVLLGPVELDVSAS